MSPEEYKRQDIEVLNEVRPYCFESDREEQWFKVGLQYGLDAADEEPLPRWISVKEDLPCNHEKLMSAKCETKKVFILKDSSGNPDIDYMLKENGKWKWFSYSSVRFWFPVPEPPKE